MEQSGSFGHLVAQVAIGLFLLLLLALFVRTALMVGSVFLLAWTRRDERSDTRGNDPVDDASDTPLGGNGA